MSKHKILLMLVTLYPLYTWADTDDADFCESAGRFAQFGAISRFEHRSAEQIDQAVIQRTTELKADALMVARYYSAVGYHSGLSPDAAFKLAEAHCAEVLHNMLSKHPVNKQPTGAGYE